MITTEREQKEFRGRGLNVHDAILMFPAERLCMRTCSELQFSSGSLVLLFVDFYESFIYSAAN
jgi:hypothetical protein